MSTKTIKTSSKQTLCLSGLVAILMAFPMASNVDAATLCTDTGADGSPRCYATANYSPKSSPWNIYGFYSFSTFSDDNVPDGFLQDAVWVIFDNGDFLEGGMFDGDSGSPKFVVAINGVTSGTSTHSPSNNVQYELGVYDDNQDGTWTMKSDSLTKTKYMGAAEAYAAKVGTEATHTNAPDNTTDHDFMYMHWNGNWVLLSSSNVNQGWTESTGWDMYPCGSGNESYYHVNTGKGTQSC